MKVLITGGCGFVGSNLAILFKKNYPGSHIFCLDNLKRRGSELNLPRLKNAGIVFVYGDIREKNAFTAIGNVDIVIDAAAEPSVLAGIDSDPDYLVTTNFNGTYNTLEFARKCKASLVFLSTSRVYPIKQLESIQYTINNTRFAINESQVLPGCSKYGISEEFPLQGYRSLYGSTKLASELLIEEYIQLLGLKAVINRCGVITGPYQMGKVDQGVVVLWMAKHFWDKSLSYIGYGGEGKQVRDILHIDDLYKLVDHQIHNIDRHNGEIFNVGGGNSVSVSLKELSHFCSEITGNHIPIKPVHENRPADIPVYITDTRKVEKACDWKPQKSVETILNEIHYWIKENEMNLKPILE